LKEDSSNKESKQSSKDRNLEKDEKNAKRTEQNMPSYNKFIGFFKNLSIVTKKDYLV
jgi:hypothetical protein